MTLFLLRFFHDEKGQSVAEYVILVLFIGLSAIVIAQIFPAAIRAYVGRIFFLLSLPIP